MIWPMAPVKARNNRQSSTLVPTITSTPAAEPARMRSSGADGSTSPSMTGCVSTAPAMLTPQASGSGCAMTSASNARCAAMMRSHRTAAIAAWVGATPSFSAKRSPIRRAVSSGTTRSAAPLCRIARRNRPSARGAASSIPMLMAPADSPQRVTLSGSPPKAAMFSRTHSIAAIWSSSPRLAVPSRRYSQPSGPER